MTALFLTLAIFLFFGVVGFSILTLFTTLRTAQSVLLGPAFGICVITLPIFFLSRLDFSVGSIAIPVAVALGATATLILAVKRPTVRLRDHFGILLVLVVALLLVARPMFDFGFDWVSYANDDMANYCLSAARFLTNGYVTPPNLTDYFSGNDYAQAYWGMQFRGIRSGPDLVLSFVWGVTKLNALQAFMPTICALELALISAAAGIAAGFTEGRRAPLITAALMAVSPMASLGVLYQLLAQVGGVALLCGTAAILCRPPPVQALRPWLSDSVVAVIALAGLLVWYPESTPFLGMGVVLYLALFTYRQPKAGLHLFCFYVFCALVAVAILNTYALSAILFVLKEQVGVGFSTNENSLFPYFLVPSGISAFWGITHMVSLPTEPYLSIDILLGFGLFVVLTAFLIPQLKKTSPAAIFCGLMLVIGILMLMRTADYGLWKLSMFMQPFVAAVIASAIVSATRLRAFFMLVAAAALILVNAHVQGRYVDASFGSGAEATFSDQPQASASRIYKQFSALFNDARRLYPSGVVSDTPNPVVAKFQALNSRGEPTTFLTGDFFGGLLFGRETDAMALFNERYFMSARTRNAANEIAARKSDDLYVRSGLDGNSFLVPKNLAKKLELPLLISNDRGTIFNKYLPQSSGLQFGWAKDISNYLIFIPSALGNYYYGGGIGRISYSQLEFDPMFSGQSFAGLGRNFIFMVRAPTQQPRLVLELTTTVAKMFDSELPHPKANGIDIPFVGRGSARVSAPVPLANIDGVPYLSIDFGREGKPFPAAPRHGMMALYGRNVNFDTRAIIGFGRAISLLSEIQYRELKTPANVQSFPADLANPGLEYSGIYEDGWVSEHCYFMLEPQPGESSLRVKGLIPLIDNKDFKTELKILVDGDVVATRDLPLGPYDIRVPIASGAGRHKIELVWDKFQRLPGDDGRPTAGQIAFVGYSEGTP